MIRTQPRERGRAWLPVLVATVTVFLLASPAVFGAEPPPGSIAGTVTLPDGTAVPDASVTTRRIETGEERVVVTGPKGDFVAAPLDAGTYRVTVHARGFAAPESRDVEVGAGRSTTVRFTLGAREAKASVVVTAPQGNIPSSIVREVDESSLAGLRPSTSDTAALLRDVPGVGLYGAGGVSSLPTIHGLADDRLRIKVDGMDLISACPNHMNPPLSYIDPSNVASVRVHAGLAPVSVGGDSIGGTIQVASAAPEFAGSGQGTLLKGQGGAFYRSNGNAWGASLSALVATESLVFSYDGSYAKAGNYRAGREFKAAGPAAMGQGWLDGDVVGSSRYETWNHALGLAFRSGAHLLELKVGIQDIPYQGFPNQRMDMTADDDTRGSLRYSGRFAWGALDGRVWGQRTRHSMNFGDDKQYWYSGTIPGMPMETKGKTSGALATADLPLSKRDNLRAGVEYQAFRLDDWWPPSGGMMAPNTFWNVNDGERDRLGIFAEWEARWTSRWSTQLGVRSETVGTDTGTVQGYYNTDMMSQYLAESTAFNAADRSRTDHNWDATALVRFTPDARQSYVAGWARKTRSPNLYERYAWSTGGMAMVMNNLVGDGNGYVGNLGLEPEVANTVSATADWHDASRESWGVSVTPYYTAVKGFVDARRCRSANMNCGAMNEMATTGFVYLQYVNQSARLYGVDVSGRVVLARTSGAGSFDATAVASWVRGENRTTGGDLYNIMPLNAKVAVVQRLAGFTNTLEAQAVAAKTHVSQVRNEVSTAGYALFHFRSSYVWKRLRFDIGVENLFDTFYSLPLGGAYVGQGMTMSGSGVPWGVPVPGPGRTVYAALHVGL